MIKAVLFDKDGVLFDFQKTWGAWAFDLLEELADGDAGLQAEMSHRMKFDLSSRTFASDSPVIAGTPEDGVELMLPLLPTWDFQGLLEYSNQRAAQAPLVETTELAPLMAELRGRALRLGVATNDAEGSARAHLRSVGAETSFDMIMGSDSGFGPKPQPGMCLAFAERMEVSVEQVVMVGDSLHDIEAGQAAGMRTIGVLTGPATYDDLVDHADVVLESIAALPAWLDNST